LKIALISDLHGNCVALDTVLADINHQKVNQVICLGDIATIGPQPLQVIDTLQRLDCLCIMGNHDAALLDLNAASDYQIAAPLIPSLHWCARQLTMEHMHYLHKFHPWIEVPIGGNASLLCYHGSPSSNIKNILTSTPVDELEIHQTDKTTRIMAGGHTHIQMVRQHLGMLLVNPGSVGSPFQDNPAPQQIPDLLPWAEYAIVEQNDGFLSVNLRRINFDTSLFCSILTESDLPVKNWWLQQYSIK
jgi:predicted phosphodiesterase